MREKYYNDAIIGNKQMVASYSKKGELLRLVYPNPDYKQMIDNFYTGVKINDSAIIYTHNDVNNMYNQYYEEDTNILNTEILNTYFNLLILQTDFIPLKHDVLVKKYTFLNKGNIDLDINFIIHSKLVTSYNNDTSGYIKNNILFQYNHDYTFSIFSKSKIESVQINNTKENIQSGVIGGKDYIGMSPDSSISYKIGTLKPGDIKELEIYINIHDNKEEGNIEKIEEKLNKIVNLDMKKEYENTKKYWRKYVKSHTNIKFKEIKDSRSEKINKIFKRTILLFPLLTNYNSGGISAAMEIDEEKKNCGRYSFCWPRDAIFVTKAMDLLNMKKETEKFYKNFCKITQSKNGMWEQRFYTDGRLAPCWGYQIDETSSVVYGVYEHYKVIEDKKFLKDTLKMCEKAISFLKKYIEDVLNNYNNIGLSYDIWEMNEGIHLYSLASIFAAYNSMIEIYKVVKDDYEGNRLKQELIQKETEELEKQMIDIKEYILKNMYDLNKKSFVRNVEDRKMDISMLSLVTPFNMFTPNEKKIKNTIERINLTLRTYTGGYIRFEEDHYMGGYNPWSLSNLWLALYYLEAGEKNKAKETLDFVIDSCSKHGFLGEQIDNATMTPSWVVGLGWAHALFIIVLEKMYK